VSSSQDTSGLLKISELAARSGVSAGTIKYYLREGVLGPLDGVVRTGRNMAWYPPQLVERIRLVKRLQEQRFLPLKVIGELLQEDPEKASRMIELEDRIIERATAIREVSRLSRKRARETYGVPQNVLARLEEIGVLTPNARGYDPDDVKIIEAMSRFRAGGFAEEIGFTVYDTLEYQRALQPLVEHEVTTLFARLISEVSVDRAVEIIESANDPLRELIGSMHAKMLVAELRRRRGEH
jgi:DNA-binding transcriptional MerR regulator